MKLTSPGDFSLSFYLAQTVLVLGKGMPTTLCVLARMFAWTLSVWCTPFSSSR